MTELKCPFCQQEYIIAKDDSCFGQQRCVCRNPNCEFDGWHFPVKVITALIETKNKLDIAVDALKKIKRSHNTESFYRATAELALEQINNKEQQ